MPWEALPDLDAQGNPVGAPEPAPKRSVWEGVKSAFTGEGRTEFPDAQEFTPAYASSADSEPRGPDGAPPVRDLSAVAQSAVVPNDEAQFDILSKAIPGLERKADKYGNLMLKAPGMSDFTYLNKPGVSARDLDEFGTQTLATLPLQAIAAPVRGAGVLANMARGALGMGASSVAQDALGTAAGSEQGIDEGRAALSAGIGAAIPAVGATARAVVGGLSGLREGAKSAVLNVTNPREAARREVQQAFQRDFESGGLGPEDAAQQADIPLAAQRGQDLRVADFGGSSVKSEARKAADFSPAAKDELMRVVGPRFEGQVPRATDVVEGEMGFNRSALQARTDLKQQARTARAPIYNQAFQAGKDGIDSPLLQQLQQSPIFQRAMGAAEHRVQDQAATPGWVSTGLKGKNGYTLEFWDQVKQTLDDYAGQAIRKGANSRGAQLTQMAQALRGELDGQGQAGKLYNQARGVAMQYFKADDALEAGSNFAKGSFNFQDAQHMVSQLNPPEKKLFAEGFADDFVQKIRSTPDRSSLLNRIMQSPMEQERVKIALGQGKFDQLEGFLRLEGIMDRLRTSVDGNSKTARFATELMKGYGTQTIGGGISAVGYARDDPKAMIFGAILAGGRAAQLRINERVADEVAHWLTGTNPDLFLKGIQAIGKQPINTAIRAFDNLLADSGMATPIAAQTTINSRQ